MAIFLEDTQVYRIFQRELPEGVYQDGAPSGSYSAASIWAKSQLLDDAYDNMEVIYNNMFPQTANEQQAEWEIKVFGYTLDGSLSLAARQALVVGQLQHRPGITKAEMIYLVQFVIGTDKDVAIGEWQNETGSWIIGVSQLGVTTIFGSGNILSFGNALWPGVDICHLTAAQVGLTQQQFVQAQDAAYTYSVLIYSYTPTALELQKLNTILTNGEPARSTHYIYGGLDPTFHI